MSARLGPEWRALVERVREAAGMASDAALDASEPFVPPMAQAWQEVVNAADALLAADRDGEAPLVFHRLGCPMSKCGASSTAAHCTCGEQSALRVMTDAELSATIGMSAPASPAPADPDRTTTGGPLNTHRQSCPRCNGVCKGHNAFDAPAPADPTPGDELDRLLDAYRDGLMSNARGSGNGRIVTVDPDRAAIHAEVQRREAAARGEVLCDGYLMLREGAGGYRFVSLSYSTPGPAMPEEIGSYAVTITRSQP